MLLQLPPELLILCLVHISDQDLVSLSHTCKTLYFLSHDRNLSHLRFMVVLETMHWRLIPINSNISDRHEIALTLVQRHVIPKAHHMFLSPHPVQGALNFRSLLSTSFRKALLSRELKNQLPRDHLIKTGIMKPGDKVSAKVHRLQFNRVVSVINEFFKHSFKRPSFHTAWKKGLLRYYDDELNFESVGVELLAKMFEGCQIGKDEEPEPNYFKVARNPPARAKVLKLKRYYEELDRTVCV
ncbi:hypothetical protein B0I72DRAFT_11408 [Yarrowia lipolytica]|jgi:hypothetical protein|uniref:YALI0C19338p n=2 Tax=Yarrowia lipolytica TaxID=4952 RepID=Q6CBF3_YARLI|nr:YALI0C19338p [Yarrowia lipolytica CLIB122]AOW03091.1 hypothetical protein YALI1_C26726g [Yarrowia lipolytica]AOW03115.1 hypothetical protein YALI1_C27330g [Yarrowia lipolytica]KAB8281379.1 hypothetical protein BKA91DRAFT_33795 [Yarrowia lipolytica]KAE8169183.1 hypothetical protein BKA90DRAFT_3071 [Yarrowia lipolytica]KAJ8053624.1 hypothetical protein LXG23DRAFT_49836 [Yarrowia lipolytica]|eukprot:XP_502009.1 YALI0C19338p [Yarrowia lipolytica CLIB122]